MANTKSKSGGKKSNTKKKTTSTTKSRSNAKSTSRAGKASETRKRNAQKAITHKKVVKEVDLWIAVAVALVLFLSNYGVCGIIGERLSSVMLGTFGWMGYIFPIVLVIFVGIIVFNEMNSGIVSKLITGAIAYIDFCLLFHLISYGGSNQSNISIYRESANNNFSGGILGGILGKVLHSLLGLTGAYIVSLAILIISIVILTEKPFMAAIRNRGMDVYENAAKDAEVRREIAATKKQRKKEEKDRQREIERQYRKQRAIGVDFGNTRLGDEPIADSNMVSNQAAAEAVNENDSATFGESLTNIDINNQDDLVPKDRVEAVKEPYRRTSKKKSVAKNPSIKSSLPDGYGDGFSELADNYNSQEVHEIHIEGIDDVLDDVPVQDDTVYTYEEEAKNTPKKAENRVVENDPHATDGEFTPKERIIVSEEAKKAMSRKPFGMNSTGGVADTANTANDNVTASSGAGENEVVNSVDSLEIETVADENKKIPSEGKIISPVKKKLKYKKPSYNLLKDSENGSSKVTRASLMETANKLKQVLANFGVRVEVTNVSKGPSVTRYELQPEMGTKVSKITGLADDIKLNMAAADIRIEAPIPGKAAVGIEIPNEGRDSVCLKELLMSKELQNHKSKLAFPAGKDIAGKVVVADIAKMPHMLIAGTTGSGKSVFTNSILMSILYRTTPEEVRLIVIDPKVVEFQVYNKIPHLLYDVVTDPKKAAGILNWAVAEMTTRYNKFAKAGARDIGSYNKKVEAGDVVDDLGEKADKLPQILIVIDELADLMMVAAKEVEEAICRLAQLARAAGIHMVIATQRPSVDVITGLIKANIPSRVALTVASGTDSRTIIDMNGAEKLLGNGDMLFYPAGYIKPVRLQGAYVSDQEIFDTVEFIKNNSGEAEYDESIDAKLTTDQEAMSNGNSDRDPLFADAGRLCIEKKKGSTSMLQRQFRVGFNRAARIMEQLCDAGVVGQEETNKPRKVIMSMEEFENIL